MTSRLGPTVCFVGTFHVYTMRQAIEEEFILDVLKNYRSHRLASKLAHEGKELDEKAVDKSAALKKLMGWVRLHPYNIVQRVQIVVEHYREHVAPLLGGQAKAMVVVASRLGPCAGSSSWRSTSRRRATSWARSWRSLVRSSTSKVKLTHHTLRVRGKVPMLLEAGEKPPERLATGST